MKYTLKNWESKILVPREPVMEKLREADAIQLRVLLYILDNPGYNEEEICEYFDITKRCLSLTLAFWEKAGLLEKAEQKKPARSKTAQSKIEKRKAEIKPVAASAEMPRYTSDQITSYIESHAGVKQLLVDCQQLIGKMFNMAETEIVIGMLDYLKLDEAYITLLFAHCARTGKKSLRYIEKLAIGFFDRGIMDYEELDSHLCAIEAAAELDRPLRKLFGIGGRALTKKEQDAFSRWSGEWEMPLDMIEKAFEVTVENTGGASIPYCNAVLERWRSNGYKTPDEIDAAMEEYRHDKSGVKDKKGSFETDDFFEAALKRSYGEKAK